jgi:hypothetical protein
MWCTALGSSQSPVLIGGPPLTVSWIAVMHVSVLS